MANPTPEPRKPSAVQPAAPQAAPALPPFSADTMDRQFGMDGAMWWVFRVVLIVLLVYGLWGQQLFGDSGAGLTVLLLAFMGLWILYNTGSARVARDLPRITELAEVGQPEAEEHLAAALARKPLQRAIRLMLYHRLALLRHRQRRLGEAAAVCHALLQRKLGAAAAIRPNLLLILAEAQVLLKDYWGAWHSLGALHGCRLSLNENLQRLAWQTRYEVETGSFASALRDLDRKIAMAELMPAPYCGWMHALLARAAAAMGWREKGDWLWRRARLLCSHEQLVALFPDTPKETEGVNDE